MVSESRGKPRLFLRDIRFGIEKDIYDLLPRSGKIAYEVVLDCLDLKDKALSAALVIINKADRLPYPGTDRQR